MGFTFLNGWGGVSKEEYFMASEKSSEIWSTMVFNNTLPFGGLRENDMKSICEDAFFSYMQSYLTIHRDMVWPTLLSFSN